MVSIIDAANHYRIRFLATIAIGSIRGLNNGPHLFLNWPFEQHDRDWLLLNQYQT
jgi:hypothetical protein